MKFSESSFIESFRYIVDQETSEKIQLYKDVITGTKRIKMFKVCVFMSTLSNRGMCNRALNAKFRFRYVIVNMKYVIKILMNRHQIAQK